jgi:hypothetical protein
LLIAPREMGSFVLAQANRIASRWEES